MRVDIKLLRTARIGGRLMLPGVCLTLDESDARPLIESGTAEVRGAPPVPFGEPETRVMGGEGSEAR